MVQSDEAVDRQCWVCFSDGPDLISPCSCTGSMKWVHRHCLDRWRVSAANPHNFTHCRHCDFEYRLVLVRASKEAGSEESRRARRRRIVGQAVAHFALWALASQVCLLLLAMLIRAVDQEERLVDLLQLHQVEGEKVGYCTFWSALRHHKSTYYLCALLLSLFLFGLSATVAICYAVTCRPAVDHRSGMRRVDCCPEDCLCLCCFEACLDCEEAACTCSGLCGGACDSSCGSCVGMSELGGEGAVVCCLGLVVLFVLTFIFIGLFFVLMAVALWLQRTAQRYLQLRELKELAGEYIVQDLSADEEAPSAGAALEPPKQVLLPGADGRATPRVEEGPTVLRTKLRKELQEIYGLGADAAAAERARRRAEEQVSGEDDSSSSE